MLATTAPDVSVIIVSYNVSELLDVCLRSLREYTTTVSYEVIVVDSASSDDSVAMMRKNHPWVRAVDCSENVGFTRGNNIGLELATGKDILYLNPDIELIEDAIGPMLQALHDDDAVGIVGCKLLNSDRTLQRSIDHFTSLRSIMNEFLLRKQREDIVIDHPNEPTKVPVVLGACLLVRGDLARELGGFDERYFMYNEETDLCLSAQEKGLATLYYPKVAMIHHGSKSSQKTPEVWQRSLHIARVSMLKFLDKHYAFPTRLVGRLIVGGSLAARFPLLLVLLTTPRQEVARLKLRYYGYTLRWILTGARVGY
jgi:N-acetylglucosaminyl-diphospho-decaprenol L-rhamnosyltransferase